MKTRIIAEIAQGYGGRPDVCDLYVDAAVKGGADAVKFQIVYADDVAAPDFEYYKRYESLQMDVSVWRGLKEKSEALGIGFFADLSGPRALEVAEAIKPHGIKMHAANFFDRSLIRSAVDMTDNLFISVGGIEIAEIDRFVDEVRGWDRIERLVLLYGYQAVPTPVNKSNLNRLILLKQRFPDVEFGYMDHTPGGSADQFSVSVMAMTLGMRWIEKHLTLSRHMELVDSISALEPDEFSEFSSAITRLGTAFGAEDLELNEEERVYRDKAIRKVVAASDLESDTEVGVDDIRLMKTSAAGQFEGFHDPSEVIGKRLSAAVQASQPITKAHIG